MKTWLRGMGQAAEQWYAAATAPVDGVLVPPGDPRHGGTWHGVDVWDTALAPIADEDVIVIATCDSGEVVRELEAAGHYRWLLAESAAQIGGPARCRDLLVGLARSRTALATERSRDVLTRAVYSHLMGDPSLCYTATTRLYEPLLGVTCGVVLDIGAYDGTTCTQWLQGGARRVIAVEPIPRPALLSLAATDRRVDVRPVAVRRLPGSVRMVDDGDGSRIMPGGEVLVNAVKLDDLLADEVTAVKIDAEGSEMEILWGGLDALRSVRPALAVSLYHSLRDLVWLPGELAAVLPGYRWTVWAHRAGPRDVVLYGAPDAVNETCVNRDTCQALHSQ